MEAFICPECGGSVDPPPVGSDYAKCTYCATSFRVDRAVPLSRDGAALAVEDASVRRAAAGGIVFIIVIVSVLAVAVFFAAFRMNAVRTQTRDTVNTAQKAQQTANDARAASDAVKKAAEEMVNKAQRTVLADNATPTPPPGKRRTGR